ncbi:MAG: rod shape-determining protein MreC [Candidatus Doudnabacteria bacterium]|nr:rod shape-determining protein MreC [Candidatus Doudnabacteria bacterium]
MSAPVHVVIAFLVLMGLVLLNLAGGLQFVQDYGRKVVEFFDIPLVAVFSGIKKFSLVVVHVDDLYDQNIILTEQVQELSAEVATLEKASAENRILREALGFEQGRSLNLLPAEVITRDFMAPDQRLVLNRGAESGVTRGAAVIVSGRVLVGVISEVFNGTSEVQLLTASGVSVNAEDAVTGATGIVKGEHGLGLLLDLISQDATVNPGDRLVTSGLGGTFPKNLLIGKIGDTRSGTSELFQNASVIPAADLSALRFVFVVKR